MKIKKMTVEIEWFEPEDKLPNDGQEIYVVMKNWPYHRIMTYSLPTNSIWGNWRGASGSNSDTYYDDDVVKWTELLPN